MVLPAFRSWSVHGTTRYPTICTHRNVGSRPMLTYGFLNLSRVTCGPGHIQKHNRLSHTTCRLRVRAGSGKQARGPHAGVTVIHVLHQQRPGTAGVPGTYRGGDLAMLGEPRLCIRIGSAHRV